MLQQSLDESEATENQPTSGFIKSEYWILMALLAVCLLSIFLLCLRFLCCRKSNRSKTEEKCAEENLIKAAETDEAKIDTASVCNLQSALTETNENPEPAKCSKATYQTKFSQTVILQPNGGTFQVGCYQFHFPRDSVSTATELKFTIGQVTKQNDKAFSIAPVLTCLPCSTKFEEKFTVFVKTSFFEATQNDVTVKVSVRDGNDSDWREESITTLGKNGEVVFTADHFSDRAIEVDNGAVSMVGRSLATLGFMKNLHPGANVLAWYVFDNYGIAYNRILQLHEREEIAINYATFKVRLDRDVILELEVPASRLEIEQARTTISSCKIREEESLSSSIKIISEPEISHSIGFSIAQFADGRYHQKVTGTLHISFPALRDDVAKRDSVVINTSKDVIITDNLNQINSYVISDDETPVNRRSRISDQTHVNRRSRNGDDNRSIRPASRLSTSTGPRSRPTSMATPYSTLGSRSEASGSSLPQSCQPPPLCSGSVREKLRFYESTNSIMR